MQSTTSQTGGAGEGRRERNKREKRARILAAARELFEEQGFEQTTARQISERAGIATGTLFLYVRDKLELLLWVFEAEAERILSRRPATSGSAVDRWMDVFGRFLTFYARNPGLSASYVKELLFIPDRPAELDRLSRTLREAVREIARDAQASGELRPDVDPVGITSEIPLRKCEAGNYVMRVRVTDEITGAKAESETTFVVLAGDAP